MRKFFWESRFFFVFCLFVCFFLINFLKEIFLHNSTQQILKKKTDHFRTFNEHLRQPVTVMRDDVCSQQTGRLPSITESGDVLKRKEVF